MQDTDPISQEEMEEASSVFFPLLRVVQKEMPEGASTETDDETLSYFAKLANDE